VAVVDPRDCLLLLRSTGGPPHAASPTRCRAQASQILAARASVPSEYYTHFMDSLTHTVRDDIAECASASYASLSLAAAQKMFKFESAAELTDYVAKKQVRSSLRWRQRAGSLTHNGDRGHVLRRTLDGQRVHVSLPPAVPRCSPPGRLPTAPSPSATAPARTATARRWLRSR
jgi:hypothetical protein